jgi:hypothetical protein
MTRAAAMTVPRQTSASNCFRSGTDGEGNAHIAVNGQEDHCLTDAREALRTLVTDIKAGKADHLL